MLNFTNLLSARPAPVKGGRMVAGYAMSGCKESHDVALPGDIEADIKRLKAEAKARSKAEAKAKRERMLANQRADMEGRLRAAMLDRGWMKTEDVEYLSGVSKTTVRLCLTTLMKRGVVARQGGGHRAFYWRWN